jgi:hypothetical protein
MDSILYQGKRIENRTWQTHYRGPLAIHRSGPGGCIVAVADLVDVIDLDALLATEPTDSEWPWDEEQDRWLVGPYCWLLSNVRLVDPIPMRGRLGLWPLPPFVSTLLEARLLSK